MRAAALSLPLLLAFGCVTDTRVPRDRGNDGFFDNVPYVKAPLKERCVAYGKGAARGRCDEAKYLAEIYVQKLSTGDQICLEGGFGDEPGAACQARASIADTASDRILIEMRNAQPGSKWAKKESSQYWFAEGALIDLYLAEHGY